MKVKEIETMFKNMKAVVFISSKPRSKLKKRLQEIGDCVCKAPTPHQLGSWREGGQLSLTRWVDLTPGQESGNARGKTVTHVKAEHY